MPAELPGNWALDARDALPDALAVLLADYPRAGWEADPGFDGLVRFWLDRHLMFRRLLDMLRNEAEARVDRAMDPAHYAQRLGRLGGMFVQELHGHHMIEDHHYFPVLATRDARIERGFELLDADHHAIDALLNRFTESANGVLRAPDDAAGREATTEFLQAVGRAETLLDRHLTDEEELIVPVILKYGTAGLPG